MSLPRAAFAASLVLLAAVPALAQQPATVPTGLAVALLSVEGGLGDGRPAIYVGRAPDSLPAGVVPPAPVTVAGGVRRGRMRTVILAYATPAAQSVAAYRSFLTASGWTAREPERMHGGFVDVTGERLVPLCRGSDLAFASGVAGAPTGSYVSVMLMPDAYSAGCRGHAAPSHSSAITELPIPVLRAPAGSSSRSSGTSGSGDSETASVRLESSMTPDALLAHYGAQLAAAGWTVGTAVVSGTLAVLPVDATDAQGNAWRGALFVVELDGARDVSLHVTRRKADR